jgi:hypothetical protein
MKDVKITDLLGSTKSPCDKRLLVDINKEKVYVVQKRHDGLKVLGVWDFDRLINEILAKVE